MGSVWVSMPVGVESAICEHCFLGNIPAPLRGGLCSATTGCIRHPEQTLGGGNSWLLFPVQNMLSEGVVFRVHVSDSRRA